jgi:NAD(P)-dependent dehydrogenase (short-subunit alcohol dehydrogenase family)
MIMPSTTSAWSDHVGPTRTAIVTGGASGIGYAISERLAADGRRVAIFDIDGEAVATAADAVGGGTIGLRVDVANRTEIDAAVAEVTRRLGRPTILVNNAGIASYDSFLELATEQWERILGVNLTGTFHCCQAVVPHMLDERWGRIVNISSASIHGGALRMTHYVASKSGVLGFTKALALELAPHGITVNTIPPGFIETPLVRALDREGSIDMDRVLAATPVGRIGQPEDIAHACAFLIAEEAGYVTAQIIGVNGGRNPSP